MARIALSGLVLALVLASCGGQQSAMTENEYVELLKGWPGLKGECRQRLRSQGWNWDFSEPACQQMEASKRWKGIWHVGMEWSNFCPDPTTECAPWFEDDEMDLHFADGKRPPEANGGFKFEIEFIGRKTKVAGHYGHLNQYEHMIVVDRLISIRTIERYPDGSGDEPPSQ